MMKRRLLTLLVALVGLTAGAQSLLVGDANQDGELTIADVTKSVDMILGREAQSAIDLAKLAYKVDNTALVGTWYLGSQAVTFNADGTTTYEGASTYKFRPLQGTLMLYDEDGAMVKVYSLLEITEEGLVLREEGGSLVAFSSTYPKYVDLGLPSGTLWATRNVGADNPEDYGLYFAWGETTGYTSDMSDEHSYNWANYQWCNDSGTTLTKYCYNSSYGYNGFTDTLTELEPEDDAAYVNWGSEWRMPTKTQQDELRTECTWTWTTQNGVNGRLVTGPNGNSIFLPAAGYRGDASLHLAGSGGYYWSRTLYTSSPNYAYYLGFGSDSVDWYRYYRYVGQNIRPVRNQ